jgi:hypothetical protein
VAGARWARRVEEQRGDCRWGSNRWEPAVVVSGKGNSEEQGKTRRGVGECLLLPLSPGPGSDKRGAQSDTRAVRANTF